jgi:hypothetical protein
LVESDELRIEAQVLIKVKEGRIWIDTHDLIKQVESNKIVKGLKDGTHVLWRPDEISLRDET